jgi:hypothetical protein
MGKYVFVVIAFSGLNNNLCSGKFADTEGSVAALVSNNGDLGEAQRKDPRFRAQPGIWKQQHHVDHFPQRQSGDSACIKSLSQGHWQPLNDTTHRSQWVWEEAKKFGFREFHKNDTFLLEGSEIHILGDSVSRQFAFTLKALFEQGRPKVLTDCSKDAEGPGHECGGVPELKTHKDQVVYDNGATRVVFYWTPQVPDLVKKLREAPWQKSDTQRIYVTANLGWWWVPRHHQQLIGGVGERTKTLENEMHREAAIFKLISEAKKACSRCLFSYRSLTAPAAAHPDNSDCTDADVRLYNQVLLKLAKRYEVDIIDTEPGTQPDQKNFPLLASDFNHIHFRTTGQYYLVDLFLNYLFACAPSIPHEKIGEKKEDDGPSDSTGRLRLLRRGQRRPRKPAPATRGAPGHGL